MPSCQTRYFGTAEYAENDAVFFPDAIAGFPGETSFVVLQRAAEYPLVYLQSTLTPDLCFLALPVQTVAAGYQLQLAPDDAELLEVPEQPHIGGDVLCLGLVAVQPSGPTVNLFAPIIMNLARHVAAQCINSIEYSHRHPLTASEGVAA